jgi:hypothetical protein
MVLLAQLVALVLLVLLVQWDFRESTELPEQLDPKDRRAHQGPQGTQV